MKEKFLSPEITKVEFDAKDVITTSGCKKHNSDEVNNGIACIEEIWTDDNK